ncbi:MAG: nitroreductase family deazaflavin-dependent oxidoreductase [Candidatus Dormibacteraceae bacterium]
MIDQFRANEGSVVEGPFKGSSILLLTTIGSQSGRPLVSPVAYSRDGARYVVLASNLGAPAHPAWYHNLAANPVVTVEVGSERFGAMTSIVGGNERNRLFDAHAAIMPNYADYQRNTTRRIPVVVLDRVHMPS